MISVAKIFVNQKKIYSIIYDTAKTRLGIDSEVSFTFINAPEFDMPLLTKQLISLGKLIQLGQMF